MLRARHARGPQATGLRYAEPDRRQLAGKASSDPQPALRFYGLDDLKGHPLVAAMTGE